MWLHDWKTIKHKRYHENSWFALKEKTSTAMQLSSKIFAQIILKIWGQPRVISSYNYIEKPMFCTRLSSKNLFCHLILKNSEQKWQI